MKRGPKSYKKQSFALNYCVFLVSKRELMLMSPAWIDGFNIVSPPTLLSIVYLVSKARAAQEGACIFLPLFPVLPYQSEKVVATPTREIEIEVYRLLAERWSKEKLHRLTVDIKTIPHSFPTLPGFIHKANFMPSGKILGHLDFSSFTIPQA